MQGHLSSERARCPMWPQAPDRGSGYRPGGFLSALPEHCSLDPGPVPQRKIRSFLSEQNNTRFDGLHDSALLNTILISDGRVFVSLDHHDAVIGKIAKFIDEVKSV